jgi:rod shape-determining protein MreD
LIEKRKKRRYARRLALSLLVLLVALAQTVPLLPPIFGVRALPLIPLVVALAILDQEVPAVCYAFVAGLIWDVFAVSRGWNAMFLTVLGFVCAMLMRYFLNRNRLSAALLFSVAVGGYLLFRWVIIYVFQRYDQAIWVLARYELPSFCYTMLLAPLEYAVVRAVVRRTSKRQGGVLAQ